jgi:uncharacterized ion transporter superfamily protein YfcC
VFSYQVSKYNVIREQHERNYTVYQTQCSSESISACGALYRIVLFVLFVSLCLIVMCCVFWGKTRAKERTKRKKEKKRAKERKYDKNKRTRKKRAERDDKMI